MTAATSAIGDGGAPPPEAGPTAAQILARAEAIAPTLVGRQAETERRTFYARDTHEEFARAGLYRILVPRRYGGHELGAETFLRVAMALARGCPSTGWMYLFGAAHALAVATLFDERAQAEVFGSGHFICPATVAPRGTADRTADGDWVLNGTWPYASGAPYATHFLGHVPVPGGKGQPAGPMMFLVPREQWTLAGDWGGQLGLKGSGSHGIVIEDALVPGHLTLRGHLGRLSVAGGTPGGRLHGGEYGGGPLSFMLLELGALAVGMAKGALDHYADLLRARETIFPPLVPRIDDPDHQFRYGEAAAMIHTAEAAVLHAVREWSGMCARGSAAFTRDEELRLALVSREAARLCWRAVEGQLVPTAGSSALSDGEPLGRVWRDMSMMHAHAGLGVFLSLVANREYTRARFGLADAAADGPDGGGR
ncbi:acyl-CoA dehydrogenase family protein [Actinomadura fibrosa]|uniref:Acyl-CoA dehydrogenase family protein n=1 Tax=Actinomadura fibrosa TaxID=111802 RepID=A0ABW2Y1J6_9ACTN|nr:acyl-CoA dehydrogenase family protein [Actinomadura fibrosa]